MLIYATHQADAGLLCTLTKYSTSYCVTCAYICYTPGWCWTTLYTNQVLQLLLPDVWYTPGWCWTTLYTNQVLQLLLPDVWYTPGWCWTTLYTNQVLHLSTPPGPVIISAHTVALQTSVLCPHEVCPQAAAHPVGLMAPGYTMLCAGHMFTITQSHLFSIQVLCFFYI